jgi:hypothetical protein
MMRRGPESAPRARNVSEMNRVETALRSTLDQPRAAECSGGAGQTIRVSTASRAPCPFASNTNRGRGRPSRNISRAFAPASPGHCPTPSDLVKSVAEDQSPRSGPRAIVHSPQRRVSRCRPTEETLRWLAAPAERQTGANRAAWIRQPSWAFWSSASAPAQVMIRRDDRPLRQGGAAPARRDGPIFGRDASAARAQLITSADEVRSRLASPPARFGERHPSHAGGAKARLLG